MICNLQIIYLKPWRDFKYRFFVCAEIILLFIQKLAMYSLGFVLFVLIYWEK